MKNKKYIYILSKFSLIDIDWSTKKKEKRNCDNKEKWRSVFLQMNPSLHSHLRVNSCTRTLTLGLGNNYDISTNTSTLKLIQIPIEYLGLTEYLGSPQPNMTA